MGITKYTYRIDKMKIHPFYPTKFGSIADLNNITCFTTLILNFNQVYIENIFPIIPFMIIQFLFDYYPIHYFVVSNLLSTIG